MMTRTFVFPAAALLAFGLAQSAAAQPPPDLAAAEAVRAAQTVTLKKIQALRKVCTASPQNRRQHGHGQTGADLLKLVANAIKQGDHQFITFDLHMRTTPFPDTHAEIGTHPPEPMHPTAAPVKAPAPEHEAHVAPTPQEVHAAEKQIMAAMHEVHGAMKASPVNGHGHGHYAVATELLKTFRHSIQLGDHEYIHWELKGHEPPVKLD